MGEEISLFRDYASGLHRDVLSDRQRQILNLPGLPSNGMPIFADYIDPMLQMLQSRLNVDTIDPIVENEGDYERATEWISELLADNRFDSLQLDVHEATLRDGDAFVLCNWDKQLGHARFYRNPAYNGNIGVIPIFDQDIMEMTSAIKILNGLYHVYQEHKSVDGDRTITHHEVALRVDADRGYSTDDDNRIPTMWPPGLLPIVRFHYRTDALTMRGVSPVMRAIPLQDGLNHSLGATLVSAIFGAYRTLFAKNWAPEIDHIVPGMIHVAFDIDEDKEVDLKAVGEGSLTPYIDQNTHLIRIMGDVLQLMFPSISGSNPSGESLKERVAGLVSQINKAQIKLGNAWEDLLRLAWSVENTYAPAGKRPPPIKRFNTVWRSAEVRDDNALVARMVQVFNIVPNQQLFLERLRDVLNLDDDEITKILEQEESNMRERLSGFNNLGAVGEFAADPRGMPSEDEDIDPGMGDDSEDDN